jgi:hypothetical protein
LEVELTELKFTTIFCITVFLMESMSMTLDLVLTIISVQKITTYRGNNIAGLNIALGAYVVAPRELDATNNWWGSPEGPSGAGPG